MIFVQFNFFWEKLNEQKRHLHQIATPSMLDDNTGTEEDGSLQYTADPRIGQPQPLNMSRGPWPAK